MLQPSFKLRSKLRIGAKVVKKYYPPMPPATRVLIHKAVDPLAKARLVRLIARADAVVLLNEIRAAQEDLGRRVDQRGMTPTVRSDEAPAVSTAVPLNAMRGEQRVIHRRPYRRTRPIPQKARMLDADEDQARYWLKRQPRMTAVEILQRLQQVAPAGVFTDKHLRTVQRALAVWRTDAIRQWIDECRMDTDMNRVQSLKVAA